MSSLIEAHKKLDCIDWKFFYTQKDILIFEPDGGTGDDDWGKGLAKSEVSMGSFSWRSASEACLDDELETRREDRRVGVDILERWRFSCSYFCWSSQIADFSLFWKSFPPLLVKLDQSVGRARNWVIKVEKIYIDDIFRFEVNICTSQLIQINISQK